MRYPISTCALLAVSLAAACGYDPHPKNGAVNPDGSGNAGLGESGEGGNAGAGDSRPGDRAADSPSQVLPIAIDGGSGVGSAGNSGSDGRGVVVSSGGAVGAGGVAALDAPIATDGDLATGDGARGPGGSGGVGGTRSDVGVSTYQVSGAVQGGPTNAGITASSGDPNAICSGNSCQIPSGGAVVLTAPSIADYYFDSWTGTVGCASTSLTLVLSNIAADTRCVAQYKATYMVGVTVTGGPAGTTITPTSSTPGSVCAVGSCRIPSGGAVSASAPSLTDWFFNGWSGSMVESASTVTVTNIVGDSTFLATYINQRTVSCTDQPPTGATTSSTPNVTSSYTTAGGWSLPALCPWTCNPDYCNTGTACAATYLDQIAFTRNTANMWFGGDDRSGIGPRSVGAGQGVTPTTTVTMDRFGFNFQGAFTCASTGAVSSQPNVLELDQRDGNGVIQATYTTTLAPAFQGGWVYWDTASTKLSAGSLYIFTSFLTTAFTWPVNTGIFGDSSAPYAGGSGYSGQVTSGDLKSWTSWGTHPWDFDFRVQMQNPACSD